MKKEKKDKHPYWVFVTLATIILFALCTIAENCSNIQLAIASGACISAIIYVYVTKKIIPFHALLAFIGLITYIPFSIWGIYNTDELTKIISQGIFIFILFAWGIIFLKESNYRIKKKFYTICIYWMLLFCIGFILIAIGYYISFVEYFVYETPTYVNTIISTGYIVFIASIFNAAVQYVCSAMLTNKEKGASFLITSLAFFILSIILTAKFFQLI